MKQNQTTGTSIEMKNDDALENKYVLNIERGISFVNVLMNMGEQMQEETFFNCV